MASYSIDQADIKVGDAGWVLELDLVDPGIDVNIATSWLILYTKPDGVTKGSWTAQPHATEKTVITRTMDGTEFDVAGTWQLRARIEGTGLRITGDPRPVNVIDAE